MHLNTARRSSDLHMIFYSIVKPWCDPRRNRLDDGRDAAAAFEKRPPKKLPWLLSKEAPMSMARARCLEASHKL